MRLAADSCDCGCAKLIMGGGAGLGYEDVWGEIKKSSWEIELGERRLAISCVCGVCGVLVMRIAVSDGENSEHLVSKML